MLKLYYSLKRYTTWYSTAEDLQQCVCSILVRGENPRVLYSTVPCVAGLKRVQYIVDTVL